MHPQPEQESIFRTVFVGWVRFRGIFRRSLRAATKKGHQLFWQEKVHQPVKILATPMTCADSVSTGTYSERQQAYTVSAKFECKHSELSENPNHRVSKI